MPAVNVNLDTEQVAVADATVAELLVVCIGRAREEIASVLPPKSEAEVMSNGALVREFHMAISDMEDALMRFNRGKYRQQGRFVVSDAERPEPESE